VAFVPHKKYPQLTLTKNVYTVCSQHKHVDNVIS